MQFLDEDHVLLCLGPPDAPLQRSHEGLVSHSFLLVLCLSQAKASAQTPDTKSHMCGMSFQGGLTAACWCSASPGLQQGPKAPA